MTTDVTAIGFADNATAIAHFEKRLSLETDCWDVYESLRQGADFILVDARTPERFATGHVPGAVNIPHRTMTAERMSQFPKDSLFVVYCAGPYCNAAQRGAARLAQLGYRVKEMIGGISGWLEQGYRLERDRVTA